MKTNQKKLFINVKKQNIKIFKSINNNYYLINLFIISDNINVYFVNFFIFFY